MMAIAKSKKVPFPFTDVPKGQVVDISKIKNPLDSKRLKNAKPKIKKPRVRISGLLSLTLLI
jgi:hypothetical protein